MQKTLDEVFSLDTEEDLRSRLVNYFDTIGFADDEIKLETKFSFRFASSKSPVIMRRNSEDGFGSKRGYSDILLTRHGRPVAIVEVKNTGHALTEDDQSQGLSYASLLDEIAPFTIITNGSETWVYDTFSRERIDDPQQSTWVQNDCRPQGIADDIRRDAAKCIVGINAETLRQFCQNQCRQALSPLTGQPPQARAYMPSVFVPPNRALARFHEWPSDTLPCFAFVGQSGAGKTNLMCYLAESAVEEGFALFYSARYLADGLWTAVVDDFSWEFHRERGHAYIVSRMSDILRGHDAQLTVFVDAVDESPGDRARIVAELADFARRIAGTPIRLCISCKEYDWRDFAIEKSDSYTPLALRTFPSSQNALFPQCSSPPRATDVGHSLALFSDEEVEEAYYKYREAYSLQGELTGQLREECRHPLMLRFVSQAYENRKTDLPIAIDRADIYARFVARGLDQIPEKAVAEAVLSTVATLEVRQGSRGVGRNDVFAGIRRDSDVERAMTGLLRNGLLVEAEAGKRRGAITFPFETLRCFCLVDLVERWSELQAEEACRRIVEDVNTRLGTEAVLFYLAVVDKGLSPVLATLADTSLDTFVAIMEVFGGDGSLSYATSEEYWNQAHCALAQYAETYSTLSRQYFPTLCRSIPPYSSADEAVGVWFNPPLYQFRTRTAANPAAAVYAEGHVESELIAQKGGPYTRIVRPGGTLRNDMHSFSTQLPQRVAWDRLGKYVDEALERRDLDETGSSVILSERIWSTFLTQPHMWYSDEPMQHGTFREMLGYPCDLDGKGLSCSNLSHGLESLLGDYKKLLLDESYSRKIRKSIRNKAVKAYNLRFWCDALRNLGRETPCEQPDVADLHDYGVDNIRACQQIERLLPHVLSSYREIVSSNFVELSRYMHLFCNHESSVLVLVGREGRSQFHTDYRKLAYLILPNAKLPGRLVVANAGSSDLWLNRRSEWSTLFGNSWCHGACFGRLEIDDEIAGYRIADPEAAFYYTRYPSGTPVLCQVYQLIRAELESIMRFPSGRWSETW